MTNFINRFQIIIFSVLTLVLSLTSWAIAKEQSGTVKMLLNQLAYFAPALMAILITLLQSGKDRTAFLKSILPFILVLIWVLAFAIMYGEAYYEMRIDKLLIECPTIIVLTVITVVLFVYLTVTNKSNSAMAQLFKVKKVNFMWYVLAIALYPLLKFVGMLVSVHMAPETFSLPDIDMTAMIPLFLVSIIFYAAIGEEVGWRGYMLNKLQLKYNPFVATLLLSIVWSIYHVGYFTSVEAYQSHQLLGVIIFTIASAFYTTWLYNKTKGNVLVLILFHASVNFAMLFTVSPMVAFILHTSLLVVVLLTGRFFKKLKEAN